MRTDLPAAQQAIQASHAVYQATANSQFLPNKHPSFVFLAVPNKQKLEEAILKTASKGVGTFQFHEPYENWGLTAFACEPVDSSKRGHFKEFPLWKL